MLHKIQIRWSLACVFFVLLNSLLLVFPVEADETSLLNEAKTIPDTHLKSANNKTVDQPTVEEAKNDNFKPVPENSTAAASNSSADSLESSDTIWPVFGGFGGYGGYGGFGRRWGGGYGGYGGYGRWGGGWGGYRRWGGGWGRGWGYPRYWSYWG